MQRRVLMDRANHRGNMMQGQAMDGHHMMPMRRMMPMMSPMMNEFRMGQQMPMMDGKNPYGSKGGYVDSNYQDSRGRDYAMDRMDHNSEYNRGQDYRSGSDYRGQDYHMGNQSYGQHPGSMQFYGYGVGQMPMMNGNDYGDYRRNDYGDYRRNDYNQGNDYGDYRRNDYNYGSDYANYNDYAMEEKEYEKHLHEWISKLKGKDRFGVPKEQVLKQAENMGVKFDKFTPEEFYATYLMMISDYKKVANDYNMYISLAKEWLEDDDIEVKGGDKLCAYLYYIVLGEKK